MSNAFALVYRPGPQWVAGTPVYRQPLAEHLAYMQGLRAQRRLVLAGPFSDDAGGLVVLAADTLADAQAVADNDPAVRGGVMQVEAHPWHLMAGVLPPAAA